MGELGDFFCFVDVFYSTKKSAVLKNKTTAGRAAVHANISSFRLLEREQLDKPESIRDGKINLQPEPSENFPARIIHALSYNFCIGVEVNRHHLDSSCVYEALVAHIRKGKTNAEASTIHKQVKD